MKKILFCIYFVLISSFLYSQETTFEANGWELNLGGGYDLLKKSYKTDYLNPNIDGFYAQAGVKKFWGVFGLNSSLRYFRNQSQVFDSLAVQTQLTQLGFKSPTLQYMNSLERFTAGIGPQVRFPLGEKLHFEVGAQGGVAFFEGGYGKTLAGDITLIDESKFIDKKIFPYGRGFAKLGYQLNERFHLSLNGHFDQYFGVNQKAQYFDFNTLQVNNLEYGVSSFGGGVAINYTLGKKIETPVEQEKKEVVKSIKVIMLDKQTNEKLKNARVKLIDEKGNISRATTDENGEVTFLGLKQGKYTIEAVLNDVPVEPYTIYPADFDTNSEDISVSLLHYDPRFTLKGFTINKSTSEIETKVYVILTNSKTGVISQAISDNVEGAFNFQLEPNASYTIFGKKDMFISEIEKVSTVGLERNTALYVKLALGLEEAEVGKVIDLKNIYYEFDKAEIREDASTDLEKLVQFLKDNEEAKVEINSHTDARGTVEYNQVLSQKRAQSVVDYLVQHDINTKRLLAKGYGESRLVNACTDDVECSEEEHQKNRRTEFVVVE